jgi:uncharacterized protein (DUF58 family)
VFPRVVALQRLGLPTRSPLAALPAREPLFEDPTRVAGVRDYRRGDSPRRIHWTATASAGRLLVRQYRRPSRARRWSYSISTRVLLAQQRYEASELSVVAASLINHIAMRERLPAGLLVEASTGRRRARAPLLRPRRSARMSRIYSTLARILAPGAHRRAA